MFVIRLMRIKEIAVIFMTGIFVLRHFVKTRCSATFDKGFGRVELDHILIYIPRTWSSSHIY